MITENIFKILLYQLSDYKTNSKILKVVLYQKKQVKVYHVADLNSGLPHKMPDHKPLRKQRKKQFAKILFK